eukprot:6173405-Pleurochrysis_carterae.AAC.1
MSTPAHHDVHALRQHQLCAHGATKSKSTTSLIDTTRQMHAPVHRSIYSARAQMHARTSPVACQACN